MSWDRLLRVAIVLGLLVLAQASLFGHVFRPLRDAVESSRWGQFVERPSVCWTAMGTLLLGVRTALWFR